MAYYFQVIKKRVNKKILDQVRYLEPYCYSILREINYYFKEYTNIKELL